MLGFGLGLNKWRRVGGGYVGLLDLFPNAVAAYSLRKLRAAYSGAAVRVRRSSDNTEQDIAFDANGELDTASLLSFVGGENRFEDSDPTSGDFGSFINGSTSANDWGLSSPSFSNKTTLDRDLGNALAYPRFDKVETGETYTMSAYVKIVDGNSATFGSALGQQGYFSLRGTVASSPSDYTVTNVTGDIYRISATIVAGGGVGSGFLRWTNANAGKIEITGFQIVKGSTLTDYVETSGGISGFGFVTTWYDQSLSNNATQTTAADQPKIVSSGSLVTENGKAAVDFDGVDDVLTLPASIGTPFTGQGKAISSFSVSSIVSGNKTLWSITGTGNDDYYFASHDGSRFKFFARGGGGTLKSSTSSNTFGAGQYLKSDILPEEAASVQNGDMYIDGTQEVTSFDYATASKTLDRGGGIGALVRSSVSGNFNGKHQELIIFNSDQSSNRTGIETNINNFYSIYP